MKFTWSFVAAAAIAVSLGWWMVLEPRASGEGVGPQQRGTPERDMSPERDGSSVRESVALEPLDAAERRAVEALRTPTERPARWSREKARGEETSRKPTPDELAQFRDYLDTARREMRAEDAQEKRRSIDSRSLDIERWASRFAESQGLGDEASSKLLDILRREQDREAEYVLLWERGAEEAQLDELRRRDREASRRELLGILTSEQIAELPRR